MNTSSESRLAPLWQQLDTQGRAALIPYVTAGFPDRSTSLELLRAIDGVADIIELGVPFSDPVADGPTIQHTSFVALQQGMSLAGTLDLLREANLTTPVVLFSYLNPVLQYGVTRLLSEAADAGISGLLLTDLPEGNDPALEQLIEDSPLDWIPLVAPTTSPGRVAEIAVRARGFLYLVARMGVTGVSTELAAELEYTVAKVREISRRPVVVGFGISTPEQAAQVGLMAEGVVVGSALMSRLENEGVAGAVAWLHTLRAALARS